MTASRPLADRFWEKVDKRGLDECWPWLGARGSSGHGQILVGRRLDKAPRVSLMLIGIEIGDLHVLHSCDNPPCVNPRHLRLGTHQENMADALDRGRVARGEAVGSAKLTEAAVIEARNRYAQGATLSSIARGYGVNTQTMRSAVYGLTWTHVPNAQVGRPKKVLNNEIVREARRRRAGGERVASIARDMGLNRATLSGAIHGHNWGHVDA